MLIIILVLFILWLLGAIFSFGGISIHLLLLIALIVLVVKLFKEK